MTSAVILAALVCTTSALVAEETKAASASAADPVIIQANGVEVKQSEFEAAVDALPDEYKAYWSGPRRRAFAEDFLRMRLLAAEAVRHKLDESPVVKARIALVTANTLANAELERMKSALAFSEDELKKTYEEKKGSYDQVSARHILIAFEGSPAVAPGKQALSDADAKAKAEAIRAKLAGGADFAEIAKLESDDRGSATRGGDLGTIPRGQMLPEFDQAAFETKPGELSPVIRTKFGYHVLKVDKHEVVPFDEVRGELELEARETRVRESLDAMADGSGAVLDPAYFGPENPVADAEATEEPHGH